MLSYLISHISTLKCNIVYSKLLFEQIFPLWFGKIIDKNYIDLLGIQNQFSYSTFVSVDEVNNT